MHPTVVDIGLQFQGDFLKNANGRNLLHYQIGVFNGQGTNTKDVDQQKNVIGGVWVMPVSGMRIGAFGWTGSYARKGTWTDEHDASYTADIQERSGVRKLSQNRYAFSFEYKQDGWTVRSEYIHSKGKAFAKSINNFNDQLQRCQRQGLQSECKNRRQGTGCIWIGYRPIGSAAKEQPYRREGTLRHVSA